MNPKDPAITQFPSPIHPEAFLRSKDEKKMLIERHVREILNILGLDLDDDSIKRTPERVARMYVDEIFSGLDPAAFPQISTYPQKTPHDELVLVKNIHFSSFCEHHFVPMIGVAHVAYLPKGKIIGLSKVNRIVHYFAKRPQLQERLNAQIADALSLILEIEDVAVFLRAQHLCVVARGVEDEASETETHVLKGEFQQVPHRRNEFFSAIRPLA